MCRIGGKKVYDRIVKIACVVVGLERIAAGVRG